MCPPPVFGPLHCAAMLPHSEGGRRGSEGGNQIRKKEKRKRKGGWLKVFKSSVCALTLSSLSFSLSVSPLSTPV